MLTDSDIWIWWIDGHWGHQVCLYRLITSKVIYYIVFSEAAILEKNTKIAIQTWQKLLLAKSYSYCICSVPYVVNVYVFWNIYVLLLYSNNWKGLRFLPMALI